MSLRWNYFVAGSCLSLLLIVANPLWAQTEEAAGHITDADHFFNGGELLTDAVQVDFDNNETGDPMISDRSRNVGEEFAHKGARISCLQPDGLVVISGYRFKHSLSRNRSVGNFFVDPRRGKNTSYQGTMRIDFCVPGQPDRATEVRAAGVFVEIVKSRHTIVEAYNASGHRVGLTQSNTDKTSFLGFESRHPIAWLEVKANRFLDTDRLNRDFAIDDLLYRDSSADPTRNLANTAVIVVEDGTRLTTEVDVTRKDLTWYYGPRRMPADAFPSEWTSDNEIVGDAKSGVFVMLKDGSVVHCELEGGQFVSSQAKDYKVPAESIIGYWGANQKCLYPATVDFEAVPGRAVVVSPLQNIVTIAPEIDFAAKKVALELDSAKIVDQEISEQNSRRHKKESAVKVIAEGGLEAVGIYDVSEITASRMPSVWLEEPPLRDFPGGFLRTYDGQEFVFDGASGFQLGKIAKDGVTVEVGESKIEIKLDNIQTLHRPKK